MLHRKSVIPGFGVSIGITLLMLNLIVLIPLSTVIIKTSGMGISHFIEVVINSRAMAAYKVSFLCSFVAAFINVIFGLIIAWVLVKYDFPFKKIMNGMIDLPFALPTAVAGIALTTLYAENGWIGNILHKLGIKVAYSLIGITIALVFMGIPFVVRTVQPVLNSLDHQAEDAACILGASRWTIFLKIILPELRSPLINGFAIAFARGLGEYGSVVFISGNMPMKTEVVPLLIMTKLEQFDYEGATAIALVMLIITFIMLLVINIVERHSNKFLKG